MNRRQTQRAAIVRNHEFVLSEAFNQATIALVRERTQLLELNYERYNTEHMEVVGNLVMPADLNAQNEHAAQVEELYLTTKVALINKLNELQAADNARLAQENVRPVLNQQNVDEILNGINNVNERLAAQRPVEQIRVQQAAVMAADIRLERISPAKFNGDYSKWSEWRSMFESLVHNNEALSNAQKFHYLKQSTGGDAERLLGGWQTTGENYVPAYDSLVELYDNQYRIVMAHLDELFKMETNARETYEGLRKLIDTANRVTRQLGVIGCPVEQWSHIIVYMFITRMAPRTQQAWETSQDLREMPTPNEVVQFLTRRARGIANLVQPSTSSGQQGNNGAKSKSTSTVNINANTSGASNNLNNNSANGNENRSLKKECFHCKGEHSLSKCNEFKKLSVSQRVGRVKQLRLCFNCFMPTHRAGSLSCKYKECGNCPGQKHNSLLCERSRVNVNSTTVSQIDQNCGANYQLSAMAQQFHPSSSFPQNGQQQNFL